MFKFLAKILHYSELLTYNRSMDEKRNTNKKSFAIILTIIAVLCILVALCLLLMQTLADRQSAATLEDLRASAQAIEEELTSTEAVADTPAEESDPDHAQDSTDDSLPSESAQPQIPAVENPYRDSFLANEDMAAWLKVPDTNIDYPVMWTPEDEIYYLYRNFEGGNDQNGCLLLDTDSCLDPLTTNLIIHGHNMRSGAMFGRLTDYEQQDFYEDHKQMILYTEECQRNYEVIAVFRSQVFKKTDTVFKFYKFFQADTQEEFDDFYSNIKEMSLYDTGVTAEFGDHFLTLSTCVYHVEQGRLVVVAKEVENGDHYLPIQ